MANEPKITEETNGVTRHSVDRFVVPDENGEIAVRVDLSKLPKRKPRIHFDDRYFEEEEESLHNAKSWDAEDN